MKKIRKNINFCKKITLFCIFFVALGTEKYLKKCLKKSSKVGLKIPIKDKAKKSKNRSKYRNSNSNKNSSNSNRLIDKRGGVEVIYNSLYKEYRVYSKMRGKFNLLGRRGFGCIDRVINKEREIKVGDFYRVWYSLFDRRIPDIVRVIGDNSGEGVVRGLERLLELSEDPKLLMMGVIENKYSIKHCSDVGGGNYEDLDKVS